MESAGGFQRSSAGGNSESLLGRSLMRLLFDTECWLWSLREPDRHNKGAKELIDGPATELYLSVASIWEIIIKNQIEKLPLPKAPEDYIPELLQLQPTKTLVITPSHIYQLPKLP